MPKSTPTPARRRVQQDVIGLQRRGAPRPARARAPMRAPHRAPAARRLGRQRSMLADALPQRLPSTYAIAKNTTSASSSTEKMGTMLGWESCAAVRASPRSAAARPVARLYGVPAADGDGRSSRSSRARNTTPVPPRPRTAFEHVTTAAPGSSMRRGDRVLVASIALVAATRQSEDGVGSSQWRDSVPRGPDRVPRGAPALQVNTAGVIPSYRVLRRRPDSPPMASHEPYIPALTFSRRADTPRPYPRRAARLDLQRLERVLGTQDRAHGQLLDPHRRALRSRSPRPGRTSILETTSSRPPGRPATL